MHTFLKTLNFVDSDSMYSSNLKQDEPMRGDDTTKDRRTKGCRRRLRHSEFLIEVPATVLPDIVQRHEKQSGWERRRFNYTLRDNLDQNNSFYYCIIFSVDSVQQHHRYSP